LKGRHGFAGSDVESIVVAGSEKMLSHHNIAEPRDIATAQYSTPFCVALACHADPRDPSVFSEAMLNDRSVRDLCRKVNLELLPSARAGNRLASRVTVRLKDGREIMEESDRFPGMPQQPLDRAALREKFETITAGLRQGRRAALFDVVATLEAAADIKTLSWVL
jgi:2-methylcitrate dehydratase PrpD